MPRMKEEDLKSLRDERSKQIAEAALKLFVQKGYHAVKISEIATAAKVSHGLFYHYYENKEKLYGELAQSVLSESYHFLLQYKEIEGSPIDVLRTMTEYILTNSNGYYFAFSLQLHTQEIAPGIKELLMEYGISHHIDALLPLFQEGQQLGLFIEGNPRDLVTCYFSTVRGLMLHSLESPSEFRFPPVDLILRGLLAAPHVS